MDSPLQFSPAFAGTTEQKLIYIFSLDDKDHPRHKGLLKIGEATVKTALDPEELTPNHPELVAAAHTRIKQYTGTVGIEYNLLWTEAAYRVHTTKSGKEQLKDFSDKDVHDVLLASDYEKVQLGKTGALEWFRVDLETAKRAIAAVKHWHASLPSGETAKASTATGHIELRAEQEQAVRETLTHFKTAHEMLWFAKMRFGKTLTALEVVRRARYRKTLIITHRPVVRSGWHDDYQKVFSKEDACHFVPPQSPDAALRHAHRNEPFLYFASIQDLRGSAGVGGKFKKNDAIFAIDWDLVIVDEAHEGTLTDLGQEVFSRLVGERTRVLYLSGTPFNLLSRFDEKGVFVWDYVMEQTAKRDWDKEHPGQHNPYAALPALHVYTYDLGELSPDFRRRELDGLAFNFHEFFRVWTGDIARDFRPVPPGSAPGRFVHEDDVRAFLDLISADSPSSRYPFATDDYRDMFRHTLWILPGVREARALSALLQAHPRFGDAYRVVNVAGDGDEERPYEDALALVQEAIASNERTITLSCGKLTAGVTVPEWTAVLMLSGTAKTAAAGYLQTIFRVQSAGSIAGRTKTDCYVFDFAPDRTLKILAEAADVSHRAGGVRRSDSENRRILGRFLNFCPVVAINGTAMQPYDVESMLQQLKAYHVERAIRNGFEDDAIYNDNLLTVGDADLADFEELRKIVGTTARTPLRDEIGINAQGFTDEDYEKAESARDKPRNLRTPEELAALKARREAREKRRKLESILRGISIRMPLLIYGADRPLSADITIDDFVTLIDDESWEEFMPAGVTKTLFRKFIHYYDRDIFVAAARKIRDEACNADFLTPTERTKAIAEIFSRFKNPDKETVLTPWRVVNMHLADTLGGWCFWDETFQSPLDVPRFVDRGPCTASTFGGTRPCILEINSKTGLYPLYVAYTLYRAKLGTRAEQTTDHATLWRLWDLAVRDSLFILCKTPMARAITRRTLAGYRESAVNTVHIDGLVEMLRDIPETAAECLLLPASWGLHAKKGDTMKFDAVVGNPPYQEMGGSGGTNDAPIFQHFCSLASRLKPAFVSMIIPARWFAAGRENLLGPFRKEMLESGKIRILHVFPNSNQLFPSVEIKGGICYYLEESGSQGPCNYILHLAPGNVSYPKRQLDRFDILIRDPRLAAIVEKVQDKATILGESPVSTILSGDTPFGIPTNPTGSAKTPIAVHDRQSAEFDVQLHYLGESQRRTVGYVRRSDIKKNAGDIDAFKVFIPKAGGSGSDPMVLSQPILAPKGSVCSQTFIYAPFPTKAQAEHFIAYLKTRFFRILVAARKITQDALSKVYAFVPLQNFKANSDIDWSAGVAKIDEQLFYKYGLTQEEIDFLKTTLKPMDKDQLAAEVRALVATVSGPAKPRPKPPKIHKPNHCPPQNPYASAPLVGRPAKAAQKPGPQ